MRNKVIILGSLLFLWGMFILPLIGFIFGLKETDKINPLGTTMAIIALSFVFIIVCAMSYFGLQDLFSSFKQKKRLRWY